MCRLFCWFHWDSALSSGVSEMDGGCPVWTVVLTRCPTVEADLAEYRAQAAVNSYVVKCIGADKSQIDSMQGDGYRMTQQSDVVAKLIHSGQCSQFKNSR